MNILIVTGNLTRDPELYKTSGGDNIAKGSIAVKREYRSGNDTTDFINFSAFKGTAEFISKCARKGSRALIQGSIQINKFTTKDNQTKEAVELVVSKFELLDGIKKEEDKPKKQPSTPQEVYDETEVTESDLPF